MGGRGTREASKRPLARLVPTQKRSRERFERILECATELMAEKGSEAFRMSDIVERAGVPFGSLYQYFPDKAAVIGTLAVRYNAVGRICVEKELASVRAVGDLHPALCRIVDGFHDMYLKMPVMRSIWQATQADRDLQELDEEDCEYLSGLLVEVLKRLAPARDTRLLTTFARLIMALIAAAVRHAITLKARDAEQVLAMFKQMLPGDLRVLA